MTSLRTNQEGISAIIVVVVILVLILSLGLAVSKTSINELALSGDDDHANKALHEAEACLEDAVFRLKRNPSYTGGTITFNEGACTVSVSGAGSTRTVTVSSMVQQETRNLTVDVSLEQNAQTTADGIDVTNWEEN